MRRRVSSPSYRSAIEQLVRARRDAELSQRDAALRLGKPASFVAKIETGERRGDFLEFIAISRAIGADPRH
jgi:hypothetical protein